ncbi:hypothetical protein Z945_1891 [Sulfitobacter noctilucae]|nr:hypothetical protein Z945_1891 [Sulfitobacter noctilucae]
MNVDLGASADMETLSGLGVSFRRKMSQMAGMFNAWRQGCG